MIIWLQTANDTVSHMRREDGILVLTKSISSTLFRAYARGGGGMSGMM